MRKQRVALKHIAQLARPRRHADTRRIVEEHAIADDDATGVGLEQAGDAIERDRLARAGRTEERRDGRLAGPCDVELEPRQALADANLQPGHQ